MLCQKCNKRVATVHLTTIINGNQITVHICEDCAGDLGELKVFKIDPEKGITVDTFSFVELMKSAAETAAGKTEKDIPDKFCPVCEMNIKDFLKKGRLGCSKCYSSFSDELMPLIGRIQPDLVHTGKTPAAKFPMIKIKNKLTEMETELKTALDEEDYENAIILRDNIRQIKDGE